MWVCSHFINTHVPSLMATPGLLREGRPSLPSYSRSLPPPYLPSSPTGPSSSSVPAASASDPTPYFVVGTAFVRAEESEPSKGRLLVLQVSGGWQGGGGLVVQVCRWRRKGSEENEPS